MAVDDRTADTAGMPTTLPPPRPLDPPSRAPVAPRTTAAAVAPSAARRATISRPAATAWVATVGASLVLLAAVLVVTSRWASIDDRVKAAGLAVATASIVAAAERVRRRLPLTTGIVAHLGAALVCPAGVAVTAAAGGVWPWCILAGGALGATALEIQHRRWNGRLMPAAQVVAVTIAAAGVAATVAIPIGLLLGALALGAMRLHRRLAALGLALLAASAPVGTLIGALGWGPGTMTRLGMSGNALDWGAPLAGALAAAVLFADARRARRTDATWLPQAAAASIGLSANVVIGIHGSTWWNEVGDWLARQGFGGGDAVIAVILAVGFAIADGLARRGRLDERAAAGVPLGLTGLWVIGSIVEQSSGLWVSIGFAVGLAAAAAGARRPNRSLLVSGTAIVTGTVLATIRGPLSNLPGWAWIALGGLALVGLAARLESVGQRQPHQPD